MTGYYSVKNYRTYHPLNIENNYLYVNIAFSSKLEYGLIMIDHNNIITDVSVFSDHLAIKTCKAQ